MVNNGWTVHLFRLTFWGSQHERWNTGNVHFQPLIYDKWIQMAGCGRFSAIWWFLKTGVPPNHPIFTIYIAINDSFLGIFGVPYLENPPHIMFFFGLAGRDSILPEINQFGFSVVGL